MDDRLAIITGGEGELAGAIAKALREAGWGVEAPGRATLEVSSPQSVGDYFAQFEEVDLLVNSAGVRADGLCATMSEGEWDTVLGTNLRGAFLCAQAAALVMMRQRRGHIINVGSFSGRAGTFGQSNYAAAKAGLIGLTQSMARELGKRNVRVNCVLPGFLETQFTADLTEEAKLRALQMHQLGRFNTTEDAARFMAFLDTMSHVSGQVFQLDSRISRWS